MITVLLDYTLNQSLKLQVLLPGGARYLDFCLIDNLLQFFLHMTKEGLGETVQFCSLTLDFAGRQCKNNISNRMCWLSYDNKYIKHLENSKICG